MDMLVVIFLVVAGMVVASYGCYVLGRVAREMKELGSPLPFPPLRSLTWAAWVGAVCWLTSPRWPRMPAKRPVPARLPPATNVRYLPIMPFNLTESAPSLRSSDHILVPRQWSGTISRARSHARDGAVTEETPPRDPDAVDPGLLDRSWH